MIRTVSLSTAGKPTIREAPHRESVVFSQWKGAPAEVIAFTKSRINNAIQKSKRA
jgi:hypothetical protein